MGQRNRDQPSVPADHLPQYVQVVPTSFTSYTPVHSTCPIGIPGVVPPYIPHGPVLPAFPPLSSVNSLAKPPLCQTEYSVSSQIDSPQRDIYVNLLWTDIIPPNGVPGHPSLLQEGIVTARPRAKAIHIRRPDQSPAYAVQNIKDKLIEQPNDGHGQGLKVSLQPSGLSKFVSGRLDIPESKGETQTWLGYYLRTSMDKKSSSASLDKASRARCSARSNGVFRGVSARTACAFVTISPASKRILDLESSSTRASYRETRPVCPGRACKVYTALHTASRLGALLSAGKSSFVQVESRATRFGQATQQPRWPADHHNIGSMDTPGARHPRRRASNFSGGYGAPPKGRSTPASSARICVRSQSDRVCEARRQSLR